MSILFSSEQVSMGHPDKICDQISDAVLDHCLSQDPYSRVACESFGKGYHIVVGGEITTTAEMIPGVTVRDIVKKVLTDIGVEDVEKYTVTDFLEKQSPDIAMGVDRGGAGDQGMMFGYACDETPSYMPLAWVMATEALELLKSKRGNILLPDAKAQVTLSIPEAGDLRGTYVDTFLISTQHREKVHQADVQRIVKPIMQEIVTKHMQSDSANFKMLVNPTGAFAIGGFIGDAGLTGRKIIADTYGGYARHGGGAFSGKDPTKVDRSGAYMARWIAKNIVALGMAKRCEVQLAYAIGVKEPVSLFIETFGTNTINPKRIESIIRRDVDLTPGGIIDRFELRRPIYSQTSTYGHFGKDNLPWEKIALRM